MFVAVSQHLLTVLSIQSVLLRIMQSCTSICSWNILFAERSYNRLVTTWRRNFVARQSRARSLSLLSLCNCYDDFYSTSCPAAVILTTSENTLLVSVSEYFEILAETEGKAKHLLFRVFVPQQ